MYYSSNVSYKKTKMTIDMINIGMTVAIMILFLTAIFWQSMRLRLFPVIFTAGAIVNALSSLKCFLNWNKKPAFFLLVVTTLLILAAAISWSVALRTV